MTEERVTQILSHALDPVLHRLEALERSAVAREGEAERRNRVQLAKITAVSTIGTPIATVLVALLAILAT